jgi:GH15 family glucan-1,4-alpha-glucosidase
LYRADRNLCKRGTSEPVGRIEDYALIGDMGTAALVGRDGSIDWFCAPRFDSAAAFAALLGDERNGRWRIAPAGEAATATRAYRDRSFVLETTFASPAGRVRVTDCMISADGNPRICRVVEGLAGRVDMHVDYVVRFDYGSVVPWVRSFAGGLLAVAGPDAVMLWSDVALEPEGLRHVANFAVSAGDRVAFELAYFASYEPMPAKRLPDDAIEVAEAAWRAWADRCTYDGPLKDIVVRSLLVLRALTYPPTGGIVAAATSSLPEALGGSRNWDYRYCWLRDATFTLFALSCGGYVDEALAWRGWLLRAVAGDPMDLQIVYGLRGTRRIEEWTVPWLSGYEGATPVRIGNDAHGQFQLDVYGEVVGLLASSEKYGGVRDDDTWALVTAIVEVVERRWREPDRGLWEIRGRPQHFTHSKVMAWVALDRAVAAVETLGRPGPLERWRAARDAIHAEVCARAYDERRATFTQSYGSVALDAATLLIPIVGFLPPDDPRVRGTVAAIERELVHDGLVYRYTQGERGTDDGLPPGEGAFLACSFWLVDNYTIAGRTSEAIALFTRLTHLCNDVGLLSEEYDPRAGRLVGNVPQAFSHVGLVNAGFNLWHSDRPIDARSRPVAE